MTEEPIDFKDLEAKYAVEPETKLDRFVVVDGAPIVPEAKIEALTKVLKKVIGKVRPIKEPHGFHMPTDESGKSMGYVFLEFNTEDDAREIIKKFNNVKLDAKHTLQVDRLGNVEKFTDPKVSTDYKEPHLEPFKPLPHLKSWLTDSQGRDQAVMHVHETVGVYWMNKDSAPREAFKRERMTDTYVQWSPRGSYLVSMHRQGVMLHAGAQFESVGRFPHHEAELIQFSPDERYLFTASRSPIPAPPEDHAQAAKWPFKETDVGNQIVLWDVQTKAPLRTFAMGDYNPYVTYKNPNHATIVPGTAAAAIIARDAEPIKWPAFKWTPDSRYFARISSKDTLSIYETPSMSLVDKKSAKISGIMDFEFAPALVGGKQMLAYWTPEVQNQTARVCLMDVATKTTIRNRSLFNVSGCRMFWQDQAQFLCVKADRLTKNKKGLFTSLEIYRLNEKSFPVEVIELKELVLNFAWEPRGDRFACISYMDLPNQIMSNSQQILSFYALERSKGLQGTWKEAYRFEKRQTNFLLWSPRGRFLLSAVRNTKPELEFWDIDHDAMSGSIKVDGALKAAKELPIAVVNLGKRENQGMTDLAFDPSGRYLATVSSIAGNTSSPGFKLWDIRGQLLREEKIDKLKAFFWRPRPPSTLSEEKRNEIKKNIKTYAAQFDAEDAARESEESEELQKKREEAYKSWVAFRADVQARLGKMGLVPEEMQVQFKDGKIVVLEREVLEEIEEEV